MDTIDALGPALLSRARNAIAAEFALPRQPEPEHQALAKPGATFVTLTINHELRGCIGMLEAVRSLEDDVRANAYAAAFRDPRFAPLSRAEYELIQIEVSLLGKAEPLIYCDEAEALNQLRPHKDGVILQYHHHRATFLPQVWEQLHYPAVFLAQLKHKAGLPFDFWDAEIKLSRYEVHKWTEAEKN